MTKFDVGTFHLCSKIIASICLLGDNDDATLGAKYVTMVLLMKKQNCAKMN